MKRLVLVIGAGQAGLAAGYHLKKAGLDFIIVERAPRIGDSWRARYASLTLFTPRSFSQLPGLDLQGDPEGYATRDEFAVYLEAYAKRMDLPVRLNSEVQRLGWSEGGEFHATLDAGENIAASHVIVATGAFQKAVIPPVAAGFDSAVVQLSAETYQEPSQIPDGPVLVVGDGASGRDIAVELATGHEVFLATGKPRRLLPERFFGRSIWWWLSALGLLRVSGHSLIGRLMRRADAFPDRDRSIDSLKRKGIGIVPRLVETAGSEVIFADKSRKEMASVIWAVGYQDDSAWLQIPKAKDRTGAIVHEKGVSPVSGLFFIGRPWQRSRASALVMGAGPHAGKIVSRIAQANTETSAVPPSMAADSTVESTGSIITES